MNIQNKKRILTLFGIGDINFASGTFASFFTCVMYFLLIIYKVNFLIPLTLFIVLMPYSIYLINHNLNLFSEIDAKEIVIDEYLGQSVPILFIYFFSDYYNYNYFSDITKTIEIILISFLSFRFFDILKIFPINIFDNIKNGYGVILDDIIAGIYSSVTLIFLIKIF